MSKVTVNSVATAKKKPRGKPFTRNDERINRKGAPKRGESWAEIITRIGDMTPSEAAEYCKAIAAKLKKIGDGITLKEAVVMRVYAALLFEPSPGLLNSFMDRVEGKPDQPITSDGALRVLIEYADDKTDASEAAYQPSGDPTES